MAIKDSDTHVFDKLYPNSAIYASPMNKNFANGMKVDEFKI